MSRLLQSERMRQVTQWISVGCVLLLFSSPLFSQDRTLHATLHGHTQEVWSVAFSSNSKTLVSAGTDDDFNAEIRLWEVATGKNTLTLRAKGVARWCVAAYSPDGKTVASGSGGNKIALWDIAKGKSTALLNDSSQFARPKVVFSPDGKTLASGGRCISDIKLWDVATGKSIATLEGYDVYGIVDLAFGSDGKELISLGVHDGIKRWDVAKGTCITTSQLDDDDLSISCAAFSAGCKLLATGGISDNGSEVSFWNAATGKNTAKLKVDDTYWNLCSVAFGPDGKTLALGCKDSTVRLWDVMAKRERAILNGHSDAVLCVAFSPDSKMLATGSKDKTIKLWDLATEN